jgi:DNA-binding transcriptional regulator YiaG
LLGLSAPALADLLGVSLRTIRYWEAGEVVPDQGKVSLLCQFVKLAEKRGAT